MASRVVEEPGTLCCAALAGVTVGRNLMTNIEEVQGSIGGDFYGCFLWKRSRFYSKMRFSRQAWQLRWVTIDQNGFRSFRNRDVETTGVRAFNVYQAARVEAFDESRLILWLSTPQGSLYFQAPNETVFYDVIEVLKRRIGEFRTLSSHQRRLLHSESQRNPLTVSVDAFSTDAPLDALEEALMQEYAPEMGETTGDGDEDIHSLLDWPKGLLQVFAHIILLPLKFLLYHTIPDVRAHGNGDDKWPGAVAMCFVWLVLLSYVMTECLENIGELIGVNSLVMGMTVSAAGTSFPNVFASMVVARQGLGNMAVSNALGGNVFNVFMGLGLPWTLYTLLGNYQVSKDLHMYYGMDAGGVIFPVLVLLALVVGYVVLLLFTGWKLYISHAYFFIALYVAFLVWVVGFKTVAPSMFST